jgi:hypothetical protein
MFWLLSLWDIMISVFFSWANFCTVQCGEQNKIPCEVYKGFFF